MSAPDYPNVNTLSDWYGVRDDFPGSAALADACAGKADDSVPEAVRAWREVARLRQWKAEANDVLAAWEGVWMIAGQPWRRGETQAQAVAREVQRLRSEVAAWMNGVADVVEPLGYDRGAACGPADLLPGLTELRAHDLEMTRRLHECVEARRYLYERLALNKRVDHHVD
ncbi:MAG: hypothetical protein IT357_05145 [Gemmatimonadaceae bacterium]|jgi:hypothetical protein|nr:hypothetical protein [Gemmatimonadaceae bacterium]